MRRIDSLFVEKFSLLIHLGKYLRSPCGTAVFGTDDVSPTAKTADFPVKFPVCREFAWRRVRSSLRRQPRSLPFAVIPRAVRESPVIGEVLRSRKVWARSWPQSAARSSKLRGGLWAIPCEPRGVSFDHDHCHLSGRIVIEPMSLFGTKRTLPSRRCISAFGG
jgi:hypothetical protein